jgi:feruloyl esterase
MHRTHFMCLVVSAALILVPVSTVRGQAFAELKNSLVDYSKADMQPRKSCEMLNRFKAKDIAQISASSIPPSGAVPAHCRVKGVLTPEIAFEVSLPDKWERTFLHDRQRRPCGENLEDAGRVNQRNEALRLGFAFAQTNTGHEASKEPGATFVLSNPQKAVDYAYRAVHLTAVTAKDITKDYYSREVLHSYWNSCSNGGRQGLLEAQRYPEDFDGIVANAPWVDQTGFTIGAMWNQKALDKAGVTPAKLAFVADKVMAKCDTIDGLKDGLIDDPRKCGFDPARDVPVCAAGTDGADCLTANQASAIAKVYSGPVSGGKSIFPGYMPGSEAVVTGLFGGGGTGSGWLNVIVSQSDAKPADFNLAENTMRYLVNNPPKPDYDYKTLISIATFICSTTGASLRTRKIQICRDSKVAAAN